MSAQTCIVLPGRFGDIINILPCARDIARKEGKCAVMVSAEFATVLEGCSYVEPVIISSHFTDVQPAIAQAQAMFPRVLVAKINERNVGVTNQCESFNEESWRQIGYLDRWQDLPLVFEQRDRKREEKLVKSLGEWPRQRSRILVNFSGKSAPFEGGDEIKRLFPPSSCHVVDLGSIRAHRIYDLLGLFEEADMLITCDTSTLHLAAASGIPVVNLVGDKPTRWHGSRPRNNSALEIRYGDVHRLKEIANVMLCWKSRTWHVWSDYPMAPDASRRHAMAARTWQDTGWIDFPVAVGDRVIQDPMRSVPFIKDVVNAAMSAAGARDTIVLTNADTCVPRAAVPIIEEAIITHGCLYSFRRDFDSFDFPMTMATVRLGKRYAGCDLFVFTVEWWKRHGHKFPDMVLGAEAWDLVLRTLMESTGGQEFKDLCYHEKHMNVWERPEHRQSLPSQKHNLVLADQFLKQGYVA